MTRSRSSATDAHHAGCAGDVPDPGDPLASRALALELFDPRLVRRLEHPSLLSSVHGRIEQVLFTLPSWIIRYQQQPEIRCTAEAVRSLLRQLPDRTRYLMVTHREAEDALTHWLDELGVAGRSQVVTAPDRLKFGSWPQDGFAVCSDASDGRRYLVEPVPYRSPEDSYATALMAAATGSGRTQVPLSFQGGNMLVGDDFWLLGMDSAVHTMRLGLAPRADGESGRAALHRAFAERLDETRQMHLVGSRIPVPGFSQDARVMKIGINAETWDEVTYRGNGAGTLQPVFHIDAFVTLAGRDAAGSYTVVIGDPGMAAELTGRDLPAHAMGPVFDDIAEQLEILGFRVVRNPLPLTYYDDEINRVRSWYFATSNNALVEIAEGTRRIWLPTYANEEHPELEHTDRANVEIWQGLGFDVHALADFHSFARNLGAAHCVAKCLARS